MAISAYQHTLQTRLSLDDHSWVFDVPNLPKTGACDAAGFIKLCTLTADSSRQNLTLSFIKAETNRALVGRPLSSFIHITCANFRLRAEDGRVATFRESAGYLARLLREGIVLNGVRYSFYGHSNSQLKSRSCVLMAGTQQEVTSVVESLGDFSSMKTVAKKVKRIGLLFSTAHTVLTVHPSRCRDTEDVERDGYIFTDGCGSISLSFARLLTQRKPIIFRNKRYHPSVFQIRYRGYKGVVVIEPKLPVDVQLEFRKSMRKFTQCEDLSFAVVDYSRPYAYGSLNDETILLLHALGISKDILARKQTEHLQYLQSALQDRIWAFRFLHFVNEVKLAEKLLLEGFETVQAQVRKKVSEEKAKLTNKWGEHKSKILIPKSRLLFGICDPYGILQDGECFVQPTLEEGGVPRALTGMSILVARNPCLHPGDLRKCKAVACPRLQHLTDCIVFPIRGRRPLADMMSGGDLDGDKFFVTWDSDIIPNEISEPAEYPGAREPLQFSKITTNDRIEYFANSSSMQLGQIKNLYLKWARLKSSLCPECQELNRLFSQCVDSNRMSIPERLKTFPEPQAEGDPFILDYLHESAKCSLQTWEKPDIVDELTPKELLLSLLSEPNAKSQFEWAQLLLRWCRTNDESFEDICTYLDFTSLSIDERSWLCSMLPAKSTLNEVIRSDLMNSNILSHVELSSVRLRHNYIRWNCVFTSSDDRLANLLETMHAVFPTFTRKLLVLQVHDRLSVAIYLPKAFPPEDEFLLGSTGRVFAFPHQKADTTGARVVVPTKHDAYFALSHNGFQLYEKKRSNTFIFFTRSPNDDSQYRNLRGIGRKARAREQTLEAGINYDWRTSIALNKFSSRLASNIGRLNREGVSGAELYVISNHDTRSIRNLDLWLEQIDTDSVHHNFERLDETTLLPREVDCTAESQVVVSLIQKHDLSVVDRLATRDDIARVLQISWTTFDAQMATAIFSRWTQRLKECTAITQREAQISHAIIDSLSLMPSLVIHFINLCPWNKLDQSVVELLVGAAMSMIKALIRCASDMSGLVVEKMKILLEQISMLNFDEMVEIVELIALDVTEPEVALDLLLGCLRPMSTRILLGSPYVTERLLGMLAGVVMDHVEEGQSLAKAAKGSSYHWRFDYPLEWSDGKGLLKCDHRIDAPQKMRLAVGDHITFTCVNPPSNLFSSRPSSFSGLVERSEVGQIVVQCSRHPPSFYRQCTWTMSHRGSFVTTKTMIEALAKLAVEKHACCPVYSAIFSSSSSKGSLGREIKSSKTYGQDRLNESQQRAVTAAMVGPLTSIWGPPGTGKTHTIVSIINSLLLEDDESRMLVTAPTHNAVDNVLRQYLRFAGTEKTPGFKVVRVSTDVHKVAADLRQYTCDAMVGKDINRFPNVRRKAQRQINESRLIFSTCIGTGLGLLRDESFDSVIVDEASQQSEPATLVPLVKGARRVILVGDHVQLRPTVQPQAQILGHDTSLFERLWTQHTTQPETSLLKRVMLNTQYRMHPDLCRFPSQSFYENNLQTAAHCATIPLPKSAFDWGHPPQRMIFIQTSSPEDHSHRSKSNKGQADLCKEIVQTLRKPPPTITLDPTATPHSQPTLAILTPYTRQATLLRQLLPAETISSIDGYQGQEADIIVYVSVRCNVHREIGFLKDLRRLNVALTRAKAGFVLIGDGETLMGKGKIVEEGEVLDEAYGVWKGLIGKMRRVEMEVRVDEVR